ncbi:hypothetical protein FGG08_006998 [Glutinoglossum americanum]|uniref:Uncharacterized protein n=1 Tax=Glutinoglossum americanum TaxID=1670608 RepID=A0A9P8I0C3_9PEZI|nr:hypothetical protein FGG08_006998 [Glutinoglossum americanum]
MWSVYWDGLEAGYYSPAICPLDYTPACERPTSTTDNYGPALEPSETATVCCPSSFQCVPTYQSYCTDSANMSAWAVQVRWQASDLPSLETNPLIPYRAVTLTTAVTPTGSNTTTTTSASATRTPTQASAQHHGLSANARAGIGIGIAIPVSFIFLGLAALFWRRKTTKDPARDTTSPEPGIQRVEPPQTEIVELAGPHYGHTRTTSDASTATPIPLVQLEDALRYNREQQELVKQRRTTLTKVQELQEEERQLQEEERRLQRQLDQQRNQPGGQ